MCSHQDTLPPRPHGIQEGQIWDTLDPTKPLGQPISKRFVAQITRAMSLDMNIAGRGVIMWFDMRMELLSFPARELDGYRNAGTIMLFCRTAPLLQHAHRSGGRCCLQVLIQFPIRMPTPSPRQEVSTSLRNCHGKIASLILATTVCQLLCQHAARIARLSAQLNWCCLWPVSVLFKEYCYSGPV